MAKKVLGKGLGAIISTAPRPVEELESAVAKSGERIVELNVGLIKPNPDQPRERFDEEAIRGLADSIKAVGLLQPILVRKAGSGYMVVAGERRLRAVKAAGLASIKAVIIKASEEENLTLAMVENIQRADLDPVDEAKSYRVLINRFKLKQQDVASRVGKDRVTVANLLRILNLPDKTQKALSDGKISLGHAKVLLSVPAERQEELFNEIIKKDLSVRALERLAEETLDDEGGKGKSRKKKKGPKNAHIKEMENMLVSLLGTKVEIRHSGSRGKIEISYYSLEDFDRIMELLK